MVSVSVVSSLAAGYQYSAPCCVVTFQRTNRNKNKNTRAKKTAKKTTRARAAKNSSWPSEQARKTAFSTAPVEQKNVAAVVRNGLLPSWLNGCFYRNGPGTFENGTEEGMLHLADGYGMVVKIDIRGRENAATISNSFVKSNAYEEYKKNGKMNWREFGTPKQVDGIGERIVDVVRTILRSVGIGQGMIWTDNASVHVIPRVDDLWAMAETVDGTFRIDKETLETKGRVLFHDDLDGKLTTAHPLVLEDGTLINLISIIGKGFVVYSCDETNIRKKIAYIPHRRPMSPSWIHDFPGNKEYVVIPEMPFYFNLASLMFGTKGTHLFLDWIPEYKTRLHVIEVSTGAVHTVDADPFFVFHWANAFTSGNHLHLDATVYDTPDIVQHYFLDTVKHGTSELPKSHLRRLTLEKKPNGSFSVVPAEDGSSWHRLSDDETRDFGDFTDFPTVATRGEKHRYVWLSAAVRPTNFTNALVKFDTETSSSIYWHEEGALPGEPCFVPAPSGAKDNEDDGVILSMLTEASGESSLLILNARDMKEHCRISCNIPISSGFHGSFVPHSFSGI